LTSFNHFDYAGKPASKFRPPKYVRWIVRGSIALLCFYLISGFFSKNSETSVSPELGEDSSSSLAHYSAYMDLPERDEKIPIGLGNDSTVKLPKSTPAHILAQKDTVLAKRLDEMLSRYRPTGALLLMVDAKTNEILAWAQRNDSLNQYHPDYISRATFPAASLIKILTAAAAMETNRYGMDSEIPQKGRNHTLYLTQLDIPNNYSGPFVTLSDAFARSINPAFGLVGQNLGGAKMRSEAKKLGFEVNFPGNMPHKSIYAPPDTGYALAESASGFTTSNTLSPLHAAAITRAIHQQKALETPWSRDPSLKGIAPVEPLNLNIPKLKTNTFYGLRQMFLRTMEKGTGQKAMRKTVYSFNRNALNIGGKTGSLDGPDPEGRYDWFTGFAESKNDPDKSVIVVVMQYHRVIRSLPSSQMAGVMINHWAKAYDVIPSKKKN
jgi:cell division protein FtsI/penicillin-binding protein 2